jgi:hypothetical protein
LKAAKVDAANDAQEKIAYKQTMIRMQIAVFKKRTREGNGHEKVGVVKRYFDELDERLSGES